MVIRLAAHGKSLGWRVRKGDDFIVVSWGPRLDKTDRKILKVLVPIVLALIFFLVILPIIL